MSFEYFAQQLSEPRFQGEWRTAFSCPSLPNDILVDVDLQFRDMEVECEAISKSSLVSEVGDLVDFA